MHECPVVVTTAVDAALTPREIRRVVLRELYPIHAAALEEKLDESLAQYGRVGRAAEVDEASAWLIAYPDQFRADDVTPLATLAVVLERHLQPEITGVHLLPFHPSSSDRGFSITSFDKIDPACGTWADVEALASSTALMADAVLNHGSASGDWFRSFLAGHTGYEGFFRVVEQGADLSSVVRPRLTPLIATFQRDDGTSVDVWATFSHDQIDFDYRDPNVLLEMIDVVMSYVAIGASAIRFDAVAFLWKVDGTSSIHLAETHRLIQLFRACIDEIDPAIMIVTETNVPHDDNVSYFGPPGCREAQAVYQFPLPPLVLHSFVAGSAVALRRWAQGIEFEGDDTTYLNFLASHDGIGLRPIEGLLESQEADALIGECEAAGGRVNHRQLADGTDTPYELTGTWYELLAVGHDESAALDRHIASHAIAFAMRGIPLVYVHSLFASLNDVDACRASGHGRDLNRANFDTVELDARLADPQSREARCWVRLREMLRNRASSPAFHPSAEQDVPDGPDELFVIRRRASTGDQALVLVNVSDRASSFHLPTGVWSTFDGDAVGDCTVEVSPWSHVWLRAPSP